MGISYCILRYLQDTIHSGSHTIDAHMPLRSVQQFVKYLEFLATSKPLYQISELHEQDFDISKFSHACYRNCYKRPNLKLGTRTPPREYTCGGHRIRYMSTDCYYYYYRYSALGPVWAETRAQSGDWYVFGTLHPGQILRGMDRIKPTRCYTMVYWTL